ncbi:MAG TPA: hypothetical protein VGB30_07875 [bacterium]
MYKIIGMPGAADKRPEKCDNTCQTYQFVGDILSDNRCGHDNWGCREQFRFWVKQIPVYSHIRETVHGLETPEAGWL